MLYHISPIAGVGVVGAELELIVLTPPAFMFPSAYILPPMPTPPETLKAPVTPEVELEVLVIDITLLVFAPRLVTD